MNQKISSIGSVPWNASDIIEAIPEFLRLYQSRPIEDNEGGMRSPHMFATWFMLRELKPEIVIESGVWRGQGTWLIESTLPDSQLFCIDPYPKERTYTSKNATYYKDDFSLMDWSHIDDKENALLFFDDHQNALERIRDGGEIGFKKFIFEDNYPAYQGGCYSLKRAFQHAGFKPSKKNSSSLSFIKNFFSPTKTPKKVLANETDQLFLENMLSIYYEFPPLFRSKFTRWGDEWTDQKYPTPPALFDRIDQEDLRIFEKEADQYTWICLAILN